MHLWRIIYFNNVIYVQPEDLQTKEHFHWQHINNFKFGFYR